jgi:hypothetical protein
MGTVTITRTTKTPQGPMLWNVTVDADIIPAAGEIIFQQPAAHLKDSTGSVFTYFLMMQGSGNNWFYSGMVSQQPHAADVKARFVSPNVTDTRPIPY